MASISAPVLTTFNNELLYVTVSEINLFLHKLLLVMVFIRAIESKLIEVGPKILSYFLNKLFSHIVHLNCSFPFPHSFQLPAFSHALTPLPFPIRKEHASKRQQPSTTK